MKIIQHKCKECRFFSDEYDKYICYASQPPLFLPNADGGCQKLDIENITDILKEED